MYTHYCVYAWAPCKVPQRSLWNLQPRTELSSRLVSLFLGLARCLLAYYMRCS